MMPATEPGSGRFRFPRTHRLRRRCDFDDVFAHGMRFTVGPLTIHGRPNGLNHCRLGLAISRRFGGAVQRNAIKRRLREAFRLNQHELPTGYDLVATTRPHEIAHADAYGRMLIEAARRIDHKCRQSNQTD